MKARIWWLGLAVFLSSCQSGVDSQVPPASSTSAETSLGEGKEFKIAKNSTLSTTLLSLGWDHSDIHALTQAAKPFRDLSFIRAGTPFKVFREPGPVRAPAAVSFKFSPVETLEMVRLHGKDWAAHLHRKPIEIQKMTFSAVVENSLWESAEEARMDPDLITELAEIFAWQVDFAREVRQGDRWRLTVERKTAGDEVVGWGRILAAEYENNGQLFSAVLFRKSEEELGYFFPDGTSLKRMFLKSPIRFGRISSRFRMKRFHPILRRVRPHLGVDYAAPRGTPIRAVGSGTVILAGRRGGGGHTVKIRHNSVYQTAYKHLNGYAPGIRRGAKVKQGQIIGYVGSTGLATGPHLHFEFYEHGRFVDPLGRKFPSADPIAKTDLPLFKEQVAQAYRHLPLWFRPGITPLSPVLASSD